MTKDQLDKKIYEAWKRWHSGMDGEPDYVPIVNPLFERGFRDGVDSITNIDKDLNLEYIIMLPVCVETGEVDYDYLRYEILTKERSENYDNELIPGWEYKEFKIIPST